MNPKKNVGKIVSLLCLAMLTVCFAATVAVRPAYATAIDLSALTDMLPTIIELMIFGMVIGLISGLMKKMTRVF